MIYVNAIMSRGVPKLLYVYHRFWRVSINSEEVEEMAATLVIPAYDRCAYPSDSAWNPEREDAIRDFEDEQFEECYEGLTSD